MTWSQERSRHVLRMLPSSLPEDRKSTRLNSSHANISYAVFCLKKKKPTPHALHSAAAPQALHDAAQPPVSCAAPRPATRSEEHTSEPHLDPYLGCPLESAPTE